MLFSHKHIIAESFLIYVEEKEKRREKTDEVKKKEQESTDLVARIPSTIIKEEKADNYFSISF